MLLLRRTSEYQLAAVARSFATAKRHTRVSELAWITTHFDLPSSTDFVADFLQAKCDFTWKTAVCVFESFFEGLGATYDVPVMLIGEHVVDFLLVFIIIIIIHEFHGNTSLKQNFRAAVL